MVASVVQLISEGTVHNRPHKVVVGLGKTGLSVVNYLVKNDDQVVVMDTRQNPPGLAEIRAVYPNVVAKLGELDQNLLETASDIIVSPGLSIQTPAIAKATAAGVPVYGDIELFARIANAPVVAITGSNGKSTVTSLVGEMGRAAGCHVKVGGNLGTPALDLYSATAPDYYILEVSSFQLETTHTLQAFCAVNLNISPDHMDRYHTLDDYIQAKLRVYRGAQHAVINVDDQQSHQHAHLPKHVLGFGESQGDFCLREHQGCGYLAADEELLINTDELNIKGRHQHLNALAALAIGTVCGFSKTSMLDTLRSYRGLPHRCQLVAIKNGVHWYNDSKATNVGAACAALQGIASNLSGRVVLLAGGQNKNSDFAPLRAMAERYVRTAILFGQDRGELVSALAGAVPIIEVSRIEDAVWQANSIAEPGDVVLLAPACASFDQFKNFEERGHHFAAAVKGQL